MVFDVDCYDKIVFIVYVRSDNSLFDFLWFLFVIIIKLMGWL